MPTENFLSPIKATAYDCHFHVFAAGESAGEARYAPDYASPLGVWQTAANKAGVSHGVVVQPSFLGLDNRLLLATLKENPERLRGVAVVDESATEAKLRNLHTRGVRGIRLNLMALADDEQAITDLPATWWSALIAAELHLELHADIGRIATLLPLLPQSATVVLDHFAKPRSVSSTDETVRALRRRQQTGAVTYITLSGGYRLGASSASLQTKFGIELAAMWLDLLGRDCLLWGSDWPCTNHESDASYSRLRESLDQWLPDAEDKHAALHSNPQRLYWR